MGSVRRMVKCVRLLFVASAMASVVAAVAAGLTDSCCVTSWTCSGGDPEYREACERNGSTNYWYAKCTNSAGQQECGSVAEQHYTCPEGNCFKRTRYPVGMILCVS